MLRKKIGIFGVILGLVLNAGLNLAVHALSVSTKLNDSAINLVNNVLGEGIVASSASRTGTVYSFSGGKDTFGIDSGIILDTSGRVSGKTDADLAKLVDYSYSGSYSTLEFELTSTGTLLNFNYVFASREFDQPVKYNDVFGLFVSVNGSAYENIALIERDDGQEVPVTINNLRAGATGTETPESFKNYPVNGKQYSLFKGASVKLNETTDGISNVFTAFKEVSVGDKVKVKFAIADVSDDKYDSYVMIEASSLAFEAPGGRPNYFTERLYNLEANTNYKIRVGGVDYAITTDENGETPIVTNDYDLFGRTIQITKVGLGQTAQTLKIAARPEPPEAVDGPDENYALPDTVQVTETSITVEAEDGQQYRIDDETNWRDQDNTGHVVFSNLTPNVEHTVYTRYTATETHPASFDSVGTTFTTRRSFEYSVQNFRGIYDGSPHSAEVISEDAQVFYSATSSGDYGTTKVEYTNPGTYPVYFLIRKEGYYSVYGELSVKIISWSATNTTNSSANYGNAMLAGDLKSAILRTDEENAELANNPEMKVYLEVEDVTETVSGQDAIKMGDKLVGTEDVEFYFDAKLYKQVGARTAERVYETETPMTVTLTPTKQIEGRTFGLADGNYALIGLHDGVAERITGTVQNGVLSFETTKFALYGIVMIPEAPSAKVNYPAEILTNLVPNTEYKISVNGTDYIVTTDANGAIPVVTNGYDLFGKQITITRLGLAQREQILQITARPEPPTPVESMDTNGVLLDTVQVTATSITITGQVGQQYRIDGGNWVEVGADGKVVFSGLQSHVVHAIETRYKATDERPASLASRGAAIRTVDELRVTVQNYRGLYDGLPHTAEVVDEEFSGIYYASEKNGTYSSDAIEFTEPGLHTAYYLVKKAGYYAVYGEVTVEIIDWTMENMTNAEGNFGKAMFLGDDLKAVVPLTEIERGVMLDDPETVVYLSVEDVTNTVSFENMSSVRKQVMSSEEILAYFDVNLFKKVGQMEPEKIHETNEPVKIVLSPDSMVDEFTELLENGQYVVVRIHDGVAERLETKVENGKVSFETDKFSIYALVRPVISQETDEEMPGSIVMGVMAEVAAATVAPVAGVVVAGATLILAPGTGALVKGVAGAMVDNLPVVIVTMIIVWAALIKFERREQRKARRRM